MRAVLGWEYFSFDWSVALTCERAAGEMEKNKNIFLSVETAAYYVE